MKKLLFAVLSLVLICACSEEKKPTKLADTKNKDIVIEDSTVYGKCFDAARVTFVLATASGDTLTYYIPDDTLEDNRIVLGSLFVDDQYAVIGYQDADGENIAKKIINLTTLMGEWEDKASGRTLDLNEDLTWIKNGNIISEKDTFSIYDLGSDTLTLENKDGIMFFSRSKK
ncbi:MAG: hypothetical protein MJZ29_07240 [Bacteroidaceae bacterium]|nr:hypothetical protein [Bacteroidaceae bacterium]